MALLITIAFLSPMIAVTVWLAFSQPVNRDDS